MYRSSYLLGALALAGGGVLFGSSAVTGCATGGTAPEPGAPADEVASSESEDVGEAASDLMSIAPFAQDDVDAQVLAQAACTALKTEGGWSFAIRRECSAFSVDCNTLCSNLTEGQAGQLRCFNSLHIYANQPSSSVASIGLKTYRYNSCGGGCGPNYCCCGN
jgi:hypothetical protein